MISLAVMGLGVCRFLQHMAMMFSYSGHYPTVFSFNGSSVLAKSSDDEVHNVHISHSSVNNQTIASLDINLDSQGLSQLLSAILCCYNKQPMVVTLSCQHVTSKPSKLGQTDLHCVQKF